MSCDTTVSLVSGSRKPVPIAVIRKLLHAFQINTFDDVMSYASPLYWDSPLPEWEAL